MMTTWFSENVLKGSTDKYHLIASCKVSIDIQICDIKLTSESKVKLLGFHVDNILNFDYQVSQLWKKAITKPHALARIFKFMQI